jgi:S1-C subfamily serine protease
MKILTKVLAAALVTVGLLTGTAQASSLEDVATNTFKMFENDRPMCTAVAAMTPAKHPVLVTAAHCVDDINSSYSVRVPLLKKDLDTYIDTIHNLEIMAVNKEKDIAVLRTKSKFALSPGVDVAIKETVSSLKFGDPVAIVAHPATLDLTITTGEFGGLVKSIHPVVKTPMLRATAPVVGGSSGGGLYVKNKQITVGKDNYELIGIVSYGLQGIDFVNHFTPIYNVEDGFKYVDMIWDN